MDNRFNNIIDMIKREAESSGITVDIRSYGDVWCDGYQCNGYFDDDNKKLVFWADDEKLAWITIALHEYSHFLQWRENTEMWRACMETLDPNAPDDNLDTWLGGKERDGAILDKEVRSLIIVENDADRRTAELIVQYGLTDIVDVQEYAQKAHAYSLFYYWVRKNRKFYTLGKEPYNNEAIWRKMPNQFGTIDLLNPPQELLDVIDLGMT